MLPKDVYTDPRILNSVNSALERGFRVVRFGSPYIDDLVMWPDGRLMNYTSTAYVKNLHRNVHLLIWEKAPYAHEILEGKF